MHSQMAPFLVIGDRLNHGSEDVRVDLLPVESADVEKIGPRDPAETRNIGRVREQSAVHIGESLRPARQVRPSAFLHAGVHGTEYLVDHLVGVRSVGGAHLLDRAGERGVIGKDVGVLGEEAENQPRHEMVHVVSPAHSTPARVVLLQLHIQPVEPPGRPDVEGALANLPDGRDPGERQEEAEVFSETGMGAHHDVAALHVLGVEVSTVGRQDELRLAAGRLRALSQIGQRRSGLALLRNLYVDVVPLENAADIGSIRRAGAEAPDGRWLVAERLQEAIGKPVRIERFPRKGRDGLFNLNGVHRGIPESLDRR